eukprot:3409183-Rhodomonas_salina.1
MPRLSTRDAIKHDGTQSSRHTTHTRPSRHKQRWRSTAPSLGGSYGSALPGSSGPALRMRAVSMS